MRDLDVWLGKTFKAKSKNNKSYDFKQYQLMPYYSKGDLSKTSKHSEQELIEMAIKCLKEIKKIHNMNYVHADLKPENFMLDDNDKVYSIDFGLAKKLKGNQKYTLAEAAGTTLYAAPEIKSNFAIFFDRAKYSKASDLYAFGIMLLRDFNIEFDPDFVKKLLSDNPKHRPSADDLLSELQSLNQQKNITITKQNSVNLNLNENEFSKFINDLTQAFDYYLANQDLDSGLLRYFNLAKDQEFYLTIIRCRNKLSLLQKNKNISASEIKSIQDSLLNLINKANNQKTLSDSYIKTVLKKHSNICEKILESNNNPPKISPN